MMLKQRYFTLDVGGGMEAYNNKAPLRVREKSDAVAYAERSQV